MDQLKSLLGLAGSAAEGYSQYEKSKLEGQLMAQQMAGKPLQVNPIVAQQAKAQAAQKVPWGWIIFAIVAIGGVVILAARPARRAAPVLPPPVTA